MKMTGGQAIVKTLARHGIDTVFGLPGVQLDNIFDALFVAKNEIRTIHTRHEQGAAYMAMGYAQTTGRVGTCLVVPGPGFLNAGAALSTAISSNVPVLCITGQIPSYQIGLKLGMTHELEDQDKAVEGVVRWHARADSPADAPKMMREAFRQMLAGRQQPVVVDMAPDIMGRLVEVELLDPETAYPQPAIDEDALLAAAKLLGGARKPVIFAGSGAFGAEEELRILAEMLGAPVILSRTGRGALSDRHELAFGPVEGQSLWRDADAALIVGTRFMTPGLAWGREGEVRLVRLDIDPVQALKPYEAEITLIAQARTGLARLCEALPAHNIARASRKPESDKIRGELQATLATEYPIQSAYSKVLREALADDDILVLDVTQMAYFVQHYMPVYKPRTLIIPGFQGTLGYAFPTGLGAKVGNPDKRVIVVSGDGGFMFNVGELSTAVAHGINLVTIVFNDRTFGNVKRFQQDSYGGRHIAVDLHNPDFQMLAESFGVLGLRAETPEALRDALKTAFAANRPALIEVPVGELPNVWKMIQRPPSQGKAI